METTVIFIKCLKIAERRKSNVLIYKYTICCPLFCLLHSVARGGRNPHPEPATTLRTAKVPSKKTDM
jgi:hypothetical protein